MNAFTWTGLGIAVFLISLPFGSGYLIYHLCKFVSDLFTKTVIGYGWVITWDPEEKRSYIRTLLLKGPAKKAGVSQGETLIAINGTLISDLPKKEYESGKFMPDIPRWKYNEETSFTLIRHDGFEHTVTMRAKIIFCGVPTYDNWPPGAMDRMQTKGHFIPTECRRTGVMHFPFFHNRDRFY